MTKPWSKLKSRVEALWEPALPLAIHCTAYANSVTRRGESRLSRHWLVLDKAIIWDFPGQFLAGGDVRGAGTHWPNGGSCASELLREYLDRPVAALLEPFPEDHWGLTDVLRAADRRIGRRALLAWATTLPTDHPAQRVLAARFQPA